MCAETGKRQGSGGDVIYPTHRKQALYHRACCAAEIHVLSGRRTGGVPLTCAESPALFGITPSRCRTITAHRREDVTHRCIVVQTTEAWSTWGTSALGPIASASSISAAGHMPMSDNEGTWIAYNGEVYNFMEVRRRTDSARTPAWSKTDTEVVLRAFLANGAKPVSID